MNLQSKLERSLSDVLKTSGYIFEIINNNKKQSNLITGTNNQFITQSITAQLAGHISRFDDILDETIAKFNDARWCLEQILENNHRQEELKLKEELERQKKLKEEEKRKLEEEEARKRKEAEDAAAAKAKAEAEREAAEQAKAVEESRLKQEREAEQNRLKDEELKRKKEEDKQREELQSQQPNNDFNDFILPGFDFNMGDIVDTGEKNSGDIPNPADILSSINCTDDALMGGLDGKDSEKNQNPTKDNTNDNAHNNSNNNNNNEGNELPGDVDLDMNNLLGNDELILDGLNMSLLDQRFDSGNTSQVPGDDEFDVDNFLNQFGGI